MRIMVEAIESAQQVKAASAAVGSAQAEKAPTDEQIDPALAQTIRDQMFLAKKAERPPSQLTQRSGITINKPFMTQDMTRLPQQKDFSSIQRGPIPKGPVGLNSHNLDIFEKPGLGIDAGNTKQNFLKSFLNQMDSADRKPVQRGYPMPGGAYAGGLNNIDANLDLVPFDSISNPGGTAKDTNPITRLA